MSVGIEDIARSATVARLYYEEKLRQTQIAELLNISQAEVSKSLRLAEEEGIVTHVVNPMFSEVVADYQNAMKDRYPHLEHVIVEPAMKGEPSGRSLIIALGMAAGSYFVSLKPHGSTVGVGCGNSLRAFAGAMERLGTSGVVLPYGAKIYSLFTHIKASAGAISPTQHVYKLIDILPDSDGVTLQFPPFMQFADQVLGFKEMVSKGHKGVELLMNTIRDLDYYMVGVGAINCKNYGNGIDSATEFTRSPEFNNWTNRLGLTEALTELDAVGEILSQPFDREGNILIDDEKLKELKDATLYLEAEVLQQHVKDQTSTVIAVVGGKVKHEPVRAALEAKVFNVLVTDSGTIEYLLGITASNGN